MKDTLKLGTQTFLNQNRQFWMLQVAGWIAYALIVFIAIIRPQLEQSNFNFSGQITNLIVETVSGFILAYLQWLFIGRIVHFTLRKTLFLSFISATTLGILFNIIKLSSYKVLVYDQRWNEAWDMLEFGGWLLFSLTTMFVWTSIFFIMLYNAKLQKEHEKLLLAQTAAKDAQLQMLRYQLNPHFMFNTMNAISTLIYKNANERANDMLDKLCEFFRYTLDKSETSVVSLRKELELLELYLSIEKARFGDRLEVDIDIDEQLMETKVPYMLLQPIVENAIKYSIESRKKGGKISVKASQKKERFVLKILDEGHKHTGKAKEGFGIGMSNTNARLNVIYSGDYQLDINENSIGGTAVTVNIPYEEI